MDDALLLNRAEFEKVFDPSAPWYEQVARFCYERDQMGFTSRKVELAIELAEGCTAIPTTFSRLAARLLEIRARHPVKHPDDVELPKVLGLTC